MENIIPRWEWRAFGQDFGNAEQRFAALAPEKVQNSAEIYLLATGSDANVKIRDQLIDIKICERVDVHGLEQWRPVLKEPFPLNSSVARQIRAALGTTDEPKSDESLSIERLLAELAPPGGRVHVVNVTKRRARYHIEGCIAELTDVIAGEKKARTVAVEDQDPGKIIAAVRAIGLEGLTNTSYPRGLKQLIRLPQ